ncbi:MAG: proteasome subunit beta, partial [Thermoprotei archaeon]
KDAIKLAIRAVNAAMRRDPGSGEGIDVVIIDENGVKELSRQEITEILKTELS